MAEILIIDDHAVVRRGIRQILSQSSAFQVSGEAASAAEAFQLLQSRLWDLVILDLSLSDQNGWDVLREIKRIWPQVPVLVLTVHPEEQYGCYAVKLKASGFLEKYKSPEELLDAVRIILNGGVYFSASVLAALQDRSTPSANLAGLSKREFAVLVGIGQGLALNQVAEKLKLSVKTVSTYRSRVLRKLNLRTTAEMIHFALTHDLARFSRPDM